jgi:hypothetical protein
MAGLTYQRIIKIIMDVVVYWGFFWNLVYTLSPPREWFNSAGYNRYLEVVSYYGALNIRSLFMKIYQAPPSSAPPIPKLPDPPVKTS